MTPITMKEVAAFLLGEASLDGYWFGERHPISPFWWREHLRAAQPATAPEPSWQDAPTCEGMWISDDFEGISTFNSDDIQAFKTNTGVRWYGPIPEDRQ